MLNFKEAIEAKIGPLGPDFVDTTPTLSQYYGSDSLACHGIRRLDETHVESFFIVPENLTGPLVRPPMFDRLKFENDTITVETEDADAREHFIETVVIDGTLISIVPGHNLAGLIVEAGTQLYNLQQENPVDLMLTEFGFIRYRGFVLPRQELALKRAIAIEDQAITLSPDILVQGQSKAKANKFHLEVVDPIAAEVKKHMLAQHWLLETTAQGFGSAAALVSAIEGKVPVFMQSEQSNFGKTPIVARDLVSTLFELLPSPPEQGFGNAEIFVNGSLHGTQRRLMVQFVPIEKIAEGIKLARSTT